MVNITPALVTARVQFVAPEIAELEHKFGFVQSVNMDSGLSCGPTALVRTANDGSWTVAGSDIILVDG